MSVLQSLKGFLKRTYDQFYFEIVELPRVNEEFFLLAAEGKTAEVQQLLNQGVIELPTRDAALCMAAYYGRTNTVKALVDNGAWHEEAWSMAKERGHQDIVIILDEAFRKISENPTWDHSQVRVSKNKGDGFTLDFTI